MTEVDFETPKVTGPAAVATPKSRDSHRNFGGPRLRVTHDFRGFEIAFRVIVRLAYIVLPVAAFYGGFVLTERVFRWKLIPFPFTPYGIAVGFGLFFCALAFLTRAFRKRI